MAEQNSTGAQLVARTLVDLGTTHAFGVPGQHALTMFAAVSAAGIDVVHTRVENNAAFAADGFARQTGDVGVVMLSTGPGALTALAGLQEAIGTSVPLLVIASQVPLAKGRGALHDLPQQTAAAGSVCKSATSVSTPAQIAPAIAYAWRVAQTAPAGPAWIEIPEDVLTARVEIDNPLVWDGTAQTDPTSGDIRDVRDCLATAQRPMIVAGGGVARSRGAAALLTSLASAIDAPVVTTPAARGTIPANHPLNAGGWIENARTFSLIAESDTVLAVGTGLGELTTGDGTMTIPGALIHVDADHSVLGRRYQGTLVWSDAGKALAALQPSVVRTPRLGAERATGVREGVPRDLRAKGFGRELDLLGELRSAVPRNAGTFWDMTTLAYWAWSAWPADHGTFHSAQGAGGLGFALPAAIGAALGSGSRTYAISGDGGAMYSLSELATAAEREASVTWILIDDGGYGILDEYARRSGVSHPVFKWASPDFLGIAASFGVPAITSTWDSLGDDVRASAHHRGPMLITVSAAIRMF